MCAQVGEWQKCKCMMKKDEIKTASRMKWTQEKTERKRQRFFRCSVFLFIFVSSARFYRRQWRLTLFTVFHSMWHRPKHTETHVKTDKMRGEQKRAEKRIISQVERMVFAVMFASVSFHSFYRFWLHRCWLTKLQEKYVSFVTFSTIYNYSHCITTSGSMFCIQHDEILRWAQGECNATTSLVHDFSAVQMVFVCLSANGERQQNNKCISNCIHCIRLGPNRRHLALLQWNT